MKKRYIIIVIVALIAIFSVFLISKKAKNQYITKDLKKDTIIQYVEASGTIKPINTIAVGTQVSGTVQKIYVDYNSVVKKGDLLAELDPSLFQANVDQSSAKLRNAKASYSRAKATLNYKKNNYQRYKHLYEKNYVSKDDVELAQANYLQAKAELDSANAEISAASAVYGIRFKNFSNFGEKFNLSINIAGITLGMKVTSAQRIMSKVIFIVVPPYYCNSHQLSYRHPLKQYHHQLYTFQ